MISVQDNNSNNNNFMPTHFSNMNISSSGHKSPVENFLKEAIQILIEASRTVNPINTTTDNTTDTHLQKNNNNNSNNNNKQKNKQKKKLTNSNNNNNNNNNDINDNNNVVIHSNDDDDDKAPWVINATWNPPYISVETDIKSLSGLEGVFEYICTSGINLLPPSSSSSSSQLSLLPPSSPSSSLENTATNVSSDQYQINNFIFAISETLRLSQVTVIPKMDIFRQYNSGQLMKQCVNAFITCDNALFMDVDLLKKKTENLLSSPSNFYSSNSSNNNIEDETSNPLDTLLVLSICSMMIRHVMAHQHTNVPPVVANGLARVYYKQAEQILEDVFDIPHISVLQSMFILSLFPHGHVDFFSLFRYSSNKLKDTIRMALAMRLDQLDLQQSSSNNNSNNNDNDINGNSVTTTMDVVDFNKEYKRRLAWMILCADHTSDINHQTGNSGLIDVNQWHVNFPQPLPNENTSRRVEFFSHYCQMVMIRKMQLFRSAYMVVSQSPEALATKMDEELFNRYKNTPQQLSITLDLENMKDATPNALSRAWTKKDLEPLLLEGLHCNTSIMALIPFLPRRYFHTFENGQLLRDSSIQEVYQLITNQASVSDCVVSPLPPSSSSQSNQHHHSSSSSASASMINKKGKNQQQNKKNKNNKNNNDDDYNEDDFKHLDDLEMHTVIRCLTAANKYVYVLEKLNEIDPIHCYHQTTHATILMLYVFDMIQTNCQQYDVALICKLNLIRLLRITKYTQKFDPDPTLIYLERMINNCTGNSTDESSIILERKTISLINKLQQQMIISSSSSISSIHHPHHA